MGFGSVIDFSLKGLTVAQLIQEAGKATQRVASIQLQDAFSWIGRLAQASLTGVTRDVATLWRALQAARIHHGRRLDPGRGPSLGGRFGNPARYSGSGFARWFRQPARAVCRSKP